MGSCGSGSLKDGWINGWGMMIKNLLLIGAGGFVGSIARYFVSRLNAHIEFLAIPVGTLLVNVLGSLLIGFLTGIAEKSPIMTVELRMLLMVGLCGGFTTFSSFTGENLMLMRNGGCPLRVLLTLFRRVCIRGRPPGTWQYPATNRLCSPDSFYNPPCERKAIV